MFVVVVVVVVVVAAAGEGVSEMTEASKPKISFSDAIQDFRTTRIEEVICYRFDQFDTAAQLLLKLASVACANSEVFSLKLLTYMIDEDTGDGSGAFSYLNAASTDMGDNEDDTVGFEPEEKRDRFDSSSVLVTTLNSLLMNNEFIKVVNKRQTSMTGKELG